MEKIETEQFEEYYLDKYGSTDINDIVDSALFQLEYEDWRESVERAYREAMGKMRDFYDDLI